MSFDLEHFTVTISNNGPDPATNVALAVNHPLADIPFEASATCQAVPGPNPNGPATCPPGSGTAPSPAFTRMGTLLKVTIPAIIQKVSAQGTVFSVKEKIRNGKPVFEVMTAQGNSAKTTYYDLITGEPIAG